MKLIRQKVTQGLSRTHERAEKPYNTRSKIVEFLWDKLSMGNTTGSITKLTYIMPSLVGIEFAVLYSSVRAKRYMSWAMQWEKVSGYSMLTTCMSPKSLNVIRRLQKAINSELRGMN